MKVVAIVAVDTPGTARLDALVQLRGETLLTHAVRGLAGAECVDSVLVTAPERLFHAAEASVRAAIPEGLPWRVLPAGAAGPQHLAPALDATDPAVEIVLVHEATRPFTPPGLVRSVVDAVRNGAPAAVPVLPMADTVKLVGAGGVITGTADRSLLRTAQTPQAFRARVLREALASGHALDPLSALGATVHTVAGHPDARRLATAFDLAVAEAESSIPSVNAGGLRP
jgi:2-C-methyl-D-erythritol 4-phosphate cytidylyltransferase